MSAHTLGPWGYSKCRCGHPNCHRFDIDHAGTEGKFYEADARLIAAAPDLLDSLERVLAWIDTLPTITENARPAIDAAHAAVAKAKGEA